MGIKAIFGGCPVLEFAAEQDRRSFLRNAALIGVGLTYVASRAGDPVAFGTADRGYGASDANASDLDILNYALTLEYLEAAFYTAGLKANLLKGRELELVDPIQQHEADHVKVVRTTITDLGGKPVAQPKVKFPDGTFSNRANFLKLAGTFEELGVKAYHGQVTLVKNPELLGAAASIAGVESRHAAIIAQITGGNPFPAPIEANLAMGPVLKAAMPFLAK
ncbi:ferritin-like domain-containing protein [Kribbella sandramycini]|uniref:Ferritin-like domain-containing protein n=1 Tax=Kribbella sandramycini TaxID=60450 RepID=A0A7Y4P0I0_9ACTN|nr:ferritin-like domain-containing protein [Kribbella sandramycini]MBB6566667.1 rubrerythrin [Kribbella sandramycini]NOL42681.1 ferritin-like domain-containing protein [Kribbella sandramycini]